MLKNLVTNLENRVETPIEVSEVRDLIVTSGLQEKIIFCRDDKMDTDKLRGVFCQYIERCSVYGEPERTTLIVYSGNMPLDWQRMVCCKELVHVFDQKEEMTDTIQELDGLLSRILAPMSEDEFNISDIMATKDRLALYQAIPLLLPLAKIKKSKHEGRSSYELAREVCVPERLVSLAMQEDWPNLISSLVS